MHKTKIFWGHIRPSFTRKDPLPTAGRDEYCRQIERELKILRKADQKKTQFIRNAYHEVRSHSWGVFVISRILADAGKKGYVKNMNKMLDDLSNASQNLKMLLSNI